MITWDEQFEKYSKYVKKQGFCYIPSDAPLEAHRLRSWQTLQIENFKEDEKERALRKEQGVSGRFKARLTQKQVKQLKSIGFVFEAVDEFWDVWMTMFTKAKLYIEENGSQLPLSDYPDKSLTTWMKRNKQLLDNKSNGKIHPKRVKLLREINFPEGSVGYRQKVFDESIKELKEFKRKNGHVRVSIKENPKLHAFIKRQKERFKDEKMDSSTVSQLRALGIVLTKRKPIKP